MNYLIKLIILYICYKNLCSSLKRINHFSFEEYYINNETFNSKDCDHSYEYSKVLKQPSKEENGTKLYICRYCQNKFVKVFLF